MSASRHKSVYQDVHLVKMAFTPKAKVQNSPDVGANLGQF